MFDGLRPVEGVGENAAPISMTLLIQIIMLVVALVIILLPRQTSVRSPRARCSMLVWI
jgi:hypothetical protein